MASTSGRKKASSSGRRNTSTNRGNGRSTSSQRTRTNEERLISNEVLLIITLAVGALLFLCNFVPLFFAVNEKSYIFAQSKQKCAIYGTKFSCQHRAIIKEKLGS